MADITKINLNGIDYNIVDSASTSAIAAEVARAQAAESANTQAIAAEVVARQSAITAVEQTLSGKADQATTYTKTEVDDKLSNAATATTQQIQQAVSGKQDTLTAGNGIDITNNVISVDIDTTLYVVVSELPAEPAPGNENKIHLVPTTSGETQNMYAEYLWKGDAWEKIGEKQIETDLSDYYNKTEVDNLLGEKVDNSTYNAYTGATNTTIGQLRDNMATVVSNLSLHTENKNNPHQVTAAQLGISASYDATNEKLILNIPAAS